MILKARTGKNRVTESKFLNKFEEHMKSKIFFIAIVTLFISIGCTDREVTGEPKTDTRQTITFTAAMPDDGTKTRVALAETEASDISVTWKSGDVISLCFVSGGTVKTLSGIALTNIRENGKKADFSFSLPEGIGYPYDLYGIYGAPLATDSKTVTFPAATSGSALSDSEPVCVMRFAAENITAATSVSVGFAHLGALLGVWLTNTTGTDHSLTSLSLSGNDSYNWLYNAAGQAAYDIASGTFTDNKAGATITFPLGSGIEITAGATTKVYRWIVPTATPDASKTITATLNGTPMPQALPAKAFTAGKYYRLKLAWTGTEWKYLSMPPASSLVAHWPMDGNANDISGNAHHGTIVGGVTPTADHKGQPNAAYLFNGTDGAIHLTDGTTNYSYSVLGLPVEAISISSWVKVLNFSSYAGIFTFIQDNYSYEYGVGLFLDGSASARKFNFAIAGGGVGLTFMPTSQALATNQWYFVTGTYDGTTMKLYVDGNLSAVSNAQSGNIAYSPSRGRIGKYEDDNEDHYFNGAINDLRIYNRALTSEEVMSLYLLTR
jgi:hypothetical protein